MERRLQALRTAAARHPNRYVHWIRPGRSAQGNPIPLQAVGDPSGSPRILIFGCIHGTECAGSAVDIANGLGCPPPDVDILFVPNLNPDGFAAGTRLNGRGVDLNRNFPASWKPIGRRGSPQFSGPKPLSEPESRLAVRLIRALRPQVTIWFHQQAEPLVRGWGRSIPAARRFSRLSGLEFHRLPWLDGTAPNWQNHRFPGGASFVVELPPGPLTRRQELAYGAAVIRLARWAARRIDRGRGRDMTSTASTR